MKPNDRSLDLQAELAPDFIVRSWPTARASARELGPLPDSIHSILIFGCGDSHHAAVSLESALATGTGRCVRAASAMEAGRYLLPRHRTEPAALLLIAISASGEVARTREVLELGRRAGAHTLALTTQPGSSLVQAAHRSLWLLVPDIPDGPGLLSYLAALLMGYALAEAWALPAGGFGLDRGLTHLSPRLGSWIESERVAAASLAAAVEPSEPTVFLGSGPALGAAMFAAAKAVEAAGVAARGQDVEEWAHLEYFCDPAGQLVWVLSSSGRSADREEELIAAAQAIGRRVHLSRWTEPSDEPWLCEMLAPLALWAGPVGFADGLMHRLGEHPFRGFGGGRARAEGGGPSRIRSSQRWIDLDGSKPGAA